MALLDRFQSIVATMRAHDPVSIGGPASDAEIRQAEEALSITFPSSYRWFLKEFGAVSWPDYIYGLGLGDRKSFNVVTLTNRERHEVEPQMPDTLVAIAPDGWGNHYCLDVSKMENEECPVVVWDHDDASDQTPEQSHASFIDWLDDQVNKRVSEEEN